jgi:hypothetical protein
MATSFREEWNASVHISLPSCLPYAKWQLRHLVARSAGFFTVDRSIKAYLKPSSALQRLPVRQCRTHPLLSETVEEFEPVGARIGVVSLSLVAARKPCSGFYPWRWCLNSIMRGRRGAGLRPHAVVAATATATAWGRTTERPGRLVRVGNVRRSATFWQSNVPRLGARTRAPTAAVRDREGKGRGTRCLHACPPGSGRGRRVVFGRTASRRIAVSSPVAAGCLSVVRGRNTWPWPAPIGYLSRRCCDPAGPAAGQGKAAIASPRCLLPSQFLSDQIIQTEQRRSLSTSQLPSSSKQPQLHRHGVTPGRRHVIFFR